MIRDAGEDSGGSVLFLVNNPKRTPPFVCEVMITFGWQTFLDLNSPGGELINLSKKYANDLDRVKFKTILKENYKLHFTKRLV